MNATPIARLCQRWLVFVGLCAILAACGSTIEADEMRACRMALPALDNQGARIALDRSAPGPFRHSLRIDYRALREGEPTRIRHVICRFSAERNAQGRRELTGLATEFGPMADASFYLLRRFYLDTPDAALGDPAPETRASGVAEVPRGVALAAQHALVALPTGAIYMLMAAAYALIYGLFGRIVLVFGEFAALASLAGVVGLGVLLPGGDVHALAGVAVAMAVGVLAAGFHGAVLARLALTPLARASGQQVLIASIGAGLTITEYLRIMQGPDLRWLPPLFNAPLPLLRSGDFTVTMTVAAMLATLIAAGAAAWLLLAMRLSAFGRAWRAVSDDATAAALFGVDERRVHAMAFTIAAALAGLAGLIVTVIYGGMGFAGGFHLGLKALIAAILGGIGSVGGAALGGLALAAMEALWSATMPIELRDGFIYAMLALILAVRPGGFFGHGDLAPRRV